MLKINGHKQLQNTLKTESFLSAEKLCLPLSQHLGKPSVPYVKEGQPVRKNQLLAKRNGPVSSALHAPTKGKILEIKKWPHPKLKKTETIILASELKDKKNRFSENPAKLELSSKESVLKLISEKGIVGMGGAGFPTQIKLSPPKKIDTLIINGCECEPFLSADSRLMVENLAEIIKGIEVINKLLEAKSIIFAVEEDKSEAIKNLNLFIHTKKFRLPPMELKILQPRYPQGSEKQLIYSLTKRKVSGSQLPFDLGCAVFNVATCYAVWEAFCCGQPLVKRIITFSGNALAKPKNLWVNIGTTLRELIEKKVIELAHQPQKIIFGGPMMGEAAGNLDHPLLKTTSGVLFLKKPLKETKEKESVCIRCGKCLNHCPMNLPPFEYVKLAKNQIKSGLRNLAIKDCIECGCCAYICPARIPIVDYIKWGKKMVDNTQ